MATSNEYSILIALRDRARRIATHRAGSSTTYVNSPFGCLREQTIRGVLFKRQDGMYDYLPPPTEGQLRLAAKGIL